MTDLAWFRPTRRHQGHIVALDSDRAGRTYALCGFRAGGLTKSRGWEVRDRLPADWPPCGNCTRIQSRRTDVEDEVATERD